MDGAAGLGGVTPDPRAGVRILGPAAGLSAAVAGAVGRRRGSEQGDGAASNEADQIARELWPTQAEPVETNDGEGLDDLWRAPLKIVTLEDLQDAARQAAPTADGVAGDGVAGDGVAGDGVSGNVAGDGVSGNGGVGAPIPLPSPDVIDLGGDRG